jgi:Calcineurin-like phosphoesterase
MPSTNPQSSRSSASGAGWTGCDGPGAWKLDVPAIKRRDSWVRPRTLWAARNDVLAKLVYDPVDRARVVWIRLARERALREGRDPDFVVRRGPEDTISFLLLGDPGEGDESQYAVVPALLSQAEDADFTIVASDVTYPAGDMGGYDNKFFRPYRNLDGPIYAIPGNHDWYDGLHGFMSHICGLDQPQAPLDVGPGLRGKIARLLWRRTMRPDDALLAEMRRARGRSTQAADPPQPGPYWAMDTGPLRIVGIDTGIFGTIDDEQAEWLRRVSFGSDRPKILVTGKPLIVNGKHLDPKLGKVVDDVVRDPRGRYVMAIGGDIHNYQRYPVTLADGRTIQYVVSGGGGAYTHATHQIRRVEVDGVTEDEFRCYPLRSDSLARFSQLYDRRLGGGRGLLELTPAEAASHLSKILKIEPTREERLPLSRRAKIAARVLQPAPAKKGFHRIASEFFDWDDPPFFKSFLRIDAGHDEVRVRCFGVSGCANAGADPPVEDEFTVALT